MNLWLPRKECKEINVKDNCGSKIIIPQVNSISYTDILIIPLCLHPQIKLSSLSYDRDLFEKFEIKILYDDLVQR